MPDRCTYDYAIVRVVPRVERGEFVNVGAIVSSDAEGYLAARFALDEARLLALDPGVDLELVRTALAAIARGLRRRRRRRRDRPPDAARALPLAGRAAQHDHPDLGGAHRPLRRPRRRARSTDRADGEDRPGRDRHERAATAAAACPDLPFRPIAELVREHARSAPSRPALVDADEHARLRRPRRDHGPRRRVAATRRRRAGRGDRDLRPQLDPLCGALPRRAARRRRRRAARGVGDAGELSLDARRRPGAPALRRRQRERRARRDDADLPQLVALDGQAPGTRLRRLARRRRAARRARSRSGRRWRSTSSIRRAPPERPRASSSRTACAGRT